MSSLIPKGWSERRQGDVVKLFNGRAYKLTEWEKEGTPVIRLQNLTGSGKDYYYSKLTLPNHQYCNFGDLLYMWSATFGAHIWKGQKAIYHYHIWKVECDEVNITKPFLYQLLKQKTEEWMNKSNGMGILHVTKGNMEEMVLTLPPLKEQQKIAAILTAVDEVIASTTAQINKLKDLKTGMMQELLTKGIGHTEFKDSPVGRIPKGWKVTTFEKIAIKIQDGTHFSPQSKEGDCLYITSKNIQDGKLDLRRISYISRSEHDEIYKRCNVQFGDVLLTKDGANTGNCAMNTLTQPFSLLSSVAFLRCDELTCLNEFLYQYILSMPCQKQITDSMTGNAITRLTLTIIKGLRIVLPTIGEQRKIVNTLGAIDRSIDQKEGKLKMLLSTKKALMQDLLTGKVRVKTNPQ